MVLLLLVQVAQPLPRSRSTRLLLLVPLHLVVLLVLGLLTLMVLQWVVQWVEVLVLSNLVVQEVLVLTHLVVQEVLVLTHLVVQEVLVLTHLVVQLTQLWVEVIIWVLQTHLVVLYFAIYNDFGDPFIEAYGDSSYMMEPVYFFDDPALYDDYIPPGEVSGEYEVEELNQEVDFTLSGTNNADNLKSSSSSSYI